MRYFERNDIYVSNELESRMQDIILPSAVLLCRDKQSEKRLGDRQILGKEKYIMTLVSLYSCFIRKLSNQIIMKDKNEGLKYWCLYKD